MYVYSKIPLFHVYEISAALFTFKNSPPFDPGFLFHFLAREHMPFDSATSNHSIYFQATNIYIYIYAHPRAP